MKKTAFIIIIFLLFITGYFYFNKPEPIQFKGVTELHIMRVSDEAAALSGNLIFHNPQKMRAQLGKLAIDVTLNNMTIGKLHESFTTTIRGEEDFAFNFQIRYPIHDVINTDSLIKTLPVSITGTAATDVLFANYSIPINYSGTVMKYNYSLSKIM